MARNVLISFIGTGNYKECVYENLSLNKKSSIVCFVQSAIAQLYTNNWKEGDKILIFESLKNYFQLHPKLIYTF